MIHARTQLYRLLQVFFESRLLAHFPWRTIEHRPAIKADPLSGDARAKARASYPYGKEREIVSIRFGMYDLTVYSSNEAPPLGKIVLIGPGGEFEEHALDESAWMRLGDFIIKQETNSYV